MTINSVGDAVPHIVTLLMACMASGGNVYEAANTIQMGLDHIKANPKQFIPIPREQLPEGHKQALEEAFGDCGEGERDCWQGIKREAPPGSGKSSEASPIITGGHQ
jgi:hypothetical protein